MISSEILYLKNEGYKYKNVEIGTKTETHSKLVNNTASQNAINEWIDFVWKRYLMELVYTKNLFIHFISIIWCNKIFWFCLLYKNTKKN